MTTLLGTPWSAVTPLLDLQPGALTAVTSMSGVGKSTFAINVATHNAGAKRPTVYCSTEISLTDLMEKILAAHLGLDIQQHGLPAEHRGEAHRMHSRVETLHFLLGDDRHTITEIERTVPAREALAPLVIVDSIQGISRRSEPDSLARNLAALKTMADEHGAAVLIVSHLSRPAQQQGVDHLPPEVVDAAATVVSLRRTTHDWNDNGNEGQETAIQTLKGTHRGKRTTLLLEPQHCRFVHTEGGR
ncbi:DnaB-like helicase C terminal domain-containing protein [Streptomyces zhaozhouensis]|uniref:DnaB-like helicase C terminal domain-containing protein n=1 Tax=Streptomyces zhaozhouensis TaxID=1300267 RepID=A0A286E7Y7_9ACTN|nr:DnaB-like helicase C-terminal domain-containing protein [Streptomyces zhaozhouensis]SOD67028.1 DnaB-like helicase C terminal domain-containing protein [Streptomyces zhaozhouensis]